MAKREFLTFKDVYVYYAHLNRPELMYQQSEDPNNQFANKEYSAQVLLPYKTLQKELVKKYKKVKSLKELKEYSAEEFKKRFKVDAPDPEVYADEDGTYHILKTTKLAWFKKTGDAAPKPEIVGFASLNNQSKNGHDITNTTILSNGTKVNLMLSLRTFNVPNSNSEGAALDLWKLQVIDLVPYKTDVPDFEDAGEVIGGETQDATADDEDFDEEFEDSGEVVEEEEVDEEFDEEF